MQAPCGCESALPAEVSHDPCTPAPAAAYPPPKAYDPAFERDACGVAFVATLTGVPSHDIVQKALTALLNLDHRVPPARSPTLATAQGILIGVPDDFFRAVVDFDLPPAGTVRRGHRLPAGGSARGATGG